MECEPDAVQRAVAFGQAGKIIFPVVRHGDEQGAVPVRRKEVPQLPGHGETGRIPVVAIFLRQEAAFDYVYARFRKAAEDLRNVFLPELPLVAVAPVAERAVEHGYVVHRCFPFIQV